MNRNQFYRVITSSDSVMACIGPGASKERARPWWRASVGANDRSIQL